MITVTVQINKESDLNALEAALNSLGLKYQTEENEWGDLSEAEIEAVQAGLNDIKAGRVFTHEEATARIAAKIKQLTNN